MKGKLIFISIILVVAAVFGLIVWRYQVNAIYQETATKTLFRPYFDAVLQNKLTDAYENFTSDSYKAVFTLDDYLAAHEKTFTENGKFVGYELNSFRECGDVFAARALVCSSVILKFERGSSPILQYKIEQGADDKFRIKFSGKKTSSGNSIDGFPF